MPDPGFVGTEILHYVLHDEQVQSATGALKISVLQEWPPQAYDQFFVAAEGVTNWVTLQAFNANGQSLTYELLELPNHGTLTGIAPDLRYAPNAAYTGPDRFTFRVHDGIAYSETGAVSIAVVQDSDWTTLTFDDFEGPAWGSYVGSNSAALESDFNQAHSGEYSVRLNPVEHADIEWLTAVDVAGPGYNAIKIDFYMDSKITVVGSGYDLLFFDGSTWHTIAEYRNIHGSDPVTEFTYNGAPERKTVFITTSEQTFPTNMLIAFRADDQELGGSTHNIYLDDVLVQATSLAALTNLRPVAHSQSLIALPGSNAVSIVAIDQEGDPMTYGYSMPTNGTLTGLAPDLIYTPNNGYSGPDGFLFWANDAMGPGNTASVGFLVDQDVTQNSLPIALDQGITVEEGLSASVTLTGSDGDGDALNFIVISNPVHGTLSGTPPDLVYTSHGGQTNEDHFAFVVHDGKESGSTGIVTVTITPDSLAPLPNAARWFVAPYQSGPGAIRMTAQGGFEASGVEYAFTSVSGGGNHSGWQDSPTYTDTGLIQGQSYTYTVKARDKSAARNQTAESDARAAVVEAGIRSLLAEDLLAYWSFDETNGTGLVDRSSLGHDGSMLTLNVSELPRWTPGQLDGAVELYTNSQYSVGNGFYIGSGGPDLPTAFTIAFWIKPNSTGDGETILSQRGESAGSTFHLYWRNSGPRLDAPGSPPFEAEGALSHGSWQHVVLTWDSGSGYRRFMVDGQVALQDYGANPIPAADPLPAERVLLMGLFSQFFPASTNGIGQSFLSASLDDMGIWGRVLDDEEIAWLYNGGAGRSVASSDQGDALIANFSPTPDEAVAPATVFFTDKTLGSPASWAWDFDGDGLVDSTVANDHFTYTAAGVYTVELTVVHSGETNRLTRTVSIYPGSHEDLGSKWFVSFGAPVPPAPWNHWNPSSLPLGASHHNLVDQFGYNPISIKVTEIPTGGSMRPREVPGNNTSHHIGQLVFEEPTPSNVLAGCWSSFGAGGALELTISNLTGLAGYQVAYYAYGRRSNAYWFSSFMVDDSGVAYSTNHVLGFYQTPGLVTSRPNGTLTLRFEDPVPRHSGLAALCLYRYMDPISVEEFRIDGTNLVASWNDVPGYYLIDRATDLLAGNWRYLGDLFETNRISWTEPQPRAYYRVRRARTITIPDPNFELAVRNEMTWKYAPTNALYDVDVDRVSTLDVSSYAISNLMGIHEFEAVTNLQVQNNALTGTLDLTANKALRIINATNNALTEIIVQDIDNLPPVFLHDPGVTVREP
ncbi:MAG: Ig-like domain-containing protein [Verrucomicrobiota bacterium]